MGKRIAAILFIFGCSTIAWVILGSTIFYRTYEAGSALTGRVASTWGAPHEQRPPTIAYEWQDTRTIEVEEKGKKIQRAERYTVTTPVGLDSSRITADFHIDYRQKGLLWFSTYKVGFDGAYGFRNPTAAEQTFVFRLPFPAKQAVYDSIELLVDDKAIPVTIGDAGVTAQAQVGGGKVAVLRARYRSQGLDSWEYKLGDQITQVRDFHLRARTDFSGFDFPDNSLSPTEKKQSGAGWELDWNYENLVSGFEIALKMPQKLQPGPLAGRISYFAPVSLFFFFFLVFILTTLRGIDLHPMNYFFLACAFFAFHLLLAYLADHISFHAAFTWCCSRMRFSLRGSRG